MARLPVKYALCWLTVLQNANSVNRIVFIDEKWFYLRSLGSKRSNRAWCSDSNNKPKLVRRTLNDKKLMVIMAVSFTGQRFLKLIPHGVTVNSTIYISALQEMHQKFVHQSAPLTWRNMLFIQDNARPHVSRETTQFMD